MAKKNQNEPITSTGETEKELTGEKVQNTVEDAKVEENTSNEKQEAEVQLKDLKVNIAFTDKYDDKIDYKINDIIKADSISKERYEELLKDERKIVSIVE